MKKSLLCMIAVLGLMVAPAMADFYTNVRPVNPLGDNVTENNLQEVFNSITMSGGINAITDQKNFAVFSPAGGGTAVATMIIELAAGAGTNAFGIYNVYAPGNMLQVFAGTAGVGNSASITFYDDGTVELNHSGIYISGVGSEFGFYLNTGARTFYSQDILNSVAGAPQALIYQGDDETEVKIGNHPQGVFTSNHFIVAFEDTPYGSLDDDFQDMVVMVESITPVPAPGAVLLGVMGLGLIGWLKRRWA